VRPWLFIEVLVYNCIARVYPHLLCWDEVGRSIIELKGKAPVFSPTGSVDRLRRDIEIAPSSQRSFSNGEIPFEDEELLIGPMIAGISALPSWWVVDEQRDGSRLDISTEELSLKPRRPWPEIKGHPGEVILMSESDKSSPHSTRIGFH
jgi:hypothetical protein